MDDTNKRVLALQHNKSITEDHITKALSDEDVLVRLVAIQRSKVTKDHITKALSDVDANVRYFAIVHPKATKEHFTKALKDEDLEVRYYAEKRLNRSTQTK